ncbi:hydantoinase B/oxoprolinase family protein [Cupriavidus sp. SK-3]|uniref:hydantoinase B/oxoprolinase family protein n=1 Tax=Cupriavidus sp. SK-3 TaxID=1470558 RepID=UPI0004509789|nr:hydantoinase B/oxoprolinase family protein [Cupriavidus sp. SK-3]KDP89475.1 hypothetical protein CF70_031235 [Cupriavidus sp. SK-3]
MQQIQETGAGREAGIDPIALEVLRHKLDGIANEMETTLLRSSFSPIVKEGLDASASIFTLSGETLAQACAVPIHLATLIPVVQAMLKIFPVEAMQDGDIYLMNDPYLGGTHLPDIAVVAPVFGDEGNPIAIVATMTHHQDVGGMSPGSIPTNATEIFQEGLRLPPLRLYRAGVLNQDLVDIVRLNVRMPDMLMGDLHAQVAACSIGAQRLAAAQASLGPVTLQQAFMALLDHSERMTADALRMLPQGTYRATGWLDNDGVNLDVRVKIEVAVTVGDGVFHVDFTGTSKQVDGPFNCVASGSQAASYFAIRALTSPDIPTNGGCFRNVTLTLPPRSIVNPDPPAPVCSRTATIKRITNTILSAFNAVLPDRVGADSAATLLAVAFGGEDADGERFVVGELIAGGSGASQFGPGASCIETDATNCMNYPVEALELAAPIRVNRVELRTNSGGAGLHRGGMGLRKEFEILGDRVTTTYRGEGHFHQAAGAFGGEAGAVAEGYILRGGDREDIKSKTVITLRKGDRLVIETPGGGGWGRA